jgi:hypothetical protein
MKRILLLTFVSAVVCVFAASEPARAATFTGYYSENFNSIGTTGTAFPSGSGWTLWYDNDGGGHTTWGTTVTAAQVLGMGSASNQAAQTAMSDSGIANSTRYADRWLNIAPSSDTSDRVISTSPTTNAGLAFQLELTNNTGSALSQITVSYDIVKFHNGWDNTGETVPSVETMPGYRLFYAIGSAGSTWNPVSALDPTSAEIPQGSLGTLGYLSLARNATIALSTPWGTGQNLYLRWVDDNAQGLSPDNIIGLNNVVVTPIPAAVWLLGTGLVGLVVIRRRRRK